MSWTAPALTHLLDQRLQTARLELLEDPRLQQARQGGGGEDNAFLRRLIDDKFAAAARSGLGAVEASLRTSASAYLTAKGLEIGQVRDRLDGLGAELVNLEGRPARMIAPEARRPVATASIFFVGWMIAITAGWQLGDGNTARYTGLAVGGALVAVLIFLVAYGSRRKRRVALVHEYPARCCRDYVDGLTMALARYEDAVNKLTA